MKWIILAIAAWFGYQYIDGLFGWIVFIGVAWFVFIPVMKSMLGDANKKSKAHMKRYKPRRNVMLKL